MDFNYTTIDWIRQHHPSWRLLCSDNAPLIISFLHRVFIAPNKRVIAESDLTEALEDELYTLREHLGSDAYPKAAAQYLADWTAPERAWLRKFYPENSDEAHYDLTPSVEKIIAWLETLEERGFVGTESRLLTLFELLREMSEQTETDPQIRIQELQKRRDDLDAQIATILNGEVPILDDTELRDRYQQFSRMAHELLTDFREVEQNFRVLDRQVRERIALWDGSKGELLDEILDERAEITESDQGKSFRAFWDFLMSPKRQEELNQRLERLLTLPTIRKMNPDLRTQKIHYDWLQAGEHTQRTVAELSRELRRFLDDQAWLENRRIMDIIKSAETSAINIRQEPPHGSLMELDAMSADIDLPLERPLFSPPRKAELEMIDLDTEEVDLDTSALYSQIYVDRTRLVNHIRRCLRESPQVSLSQLIEREPLQQGLAELVGYLQLGDETFQTIIDDSIEDTITWATTTENANSPSVERRARLPRFIFMEKAP